MKKLYFILGLALLFMSFIPWFANSDFFYPEPQWLVNTDSTTSLNWGLYDGLWLMRLGFFMTWFIGFILMFITVKWINNLIYPRIEELRHNLNIKKYMYTLHSLVMVGMVIFILYKMMPQAFAWCSIYTSYNLFPNILSTTIIIFYFSVFEIWLSGKNYFISKKLFFSIVVWWYFFTVIDEFTGQSYLRYLVFGWYILWFIFSVKFFQRAIRLLPYTSKLDRFCLIVLSLSILLSFKIIFNDMCW